MEGYLQLKEPSSKKLFRFKKKPPKFQVLWVVLDRQTLTYYEKLDLRLKEAVNIRDGFSIKDCSAVKLEYGQEMLKYGFKIFSDDSNKECIATFETGDPVICGSWISAINKAAKLHQDEEGRIGVRSKFCQVLDLDPNQKLSQAIISKAYKKKALTAHPDKGGDAELFDQVKQAYAELSSMQQYDDDWDDFKIETYTVVVEKCGQGVGLGIDVQEDHKRGEILVKYLDKSIKIRSIEPLSVGTIKPYDVLIGIDKDDCSSWFLSRVKCRLNTMRVPVGECVTLRFKRSTSGGRGGRKQKEEEEAQAWEEKAKQDEERAKLDKERLQKQMLEESEREEKKDGEEVGATGGFFTWVIESSKNLFTNPLGLGHGGAGDSLFSAGPTPAGVDEEAKDEFNGEAGGPDGTAAEKEGGVGPSERLGDGFDILPWLLPGFESLTSLATMWTPEGGLAAQAPEGSGGSGEEEKDEKKEEEEGDDAPGGGGVLDMNSLVRWNDTPVSLGSRDFVSWALCDTRELGPTQEEIVFRRLLETEKQEQVRLAEREREGLVFNRDKDILHDIRTNEKLRSRQDLRGSLDEIDRLREEELRWRAKTETLRESHERKLETQKSNSSFW